MSYKFVVVIILCGFTLFAYINATYASNLTNSNEAAQEMSLTFARCSGVYQAVSDVHSATDAPLLSKNTKEKANGAQVASAWLLFSTGIIPEWKNAFKYAENTSSSTKLSYMASFEKVDANKALDDLLIAMKKCNELLELQDQIVQEVRLKLYSMEAE